MHFKEYLLSSCLSSLKSLIYLQLCNAYSIFCMEETGDNSVPYQVKAVAVAMFVTELPSTAARGRTPVLRRAKHDEAVPPDPRRG